MFSELHRHEAIDFLLRYRGSEPVVLTSIEPRGNPLRISRTFRPVHEKGEMQTWIDDRQGSKNLYFTVNPASVPFIGPGKVEHIHIRGVTALQVDLDPSHCAERKRLLRRLRSFRPAPSLIVDSGGGYQGLWLLDREYPLTDEHTSAPLDAFNTHIAIQLGGDPCCCPIDTLMRLPGTINIPDERKLERGRVAAIARLVEYHERRRYPLSAFTPVTTLADEEDGDWDEFPDWERGSSDFTLLPTGSPFEGIPF